MKSLYDIFMKPLEKRGINKARRNLIPQASGVVLEIGVGTCANLEFYNMEYIKRLLLTDKKISKTAKNNKDIEVIQVDVEHLPFEDESIDYIVHTLVFCSVPNVSKGLGELNRVLKDNGKIIFIEHVLPQKNGLRRFFKLVNPIWKRISSGCNVVREYENSLRNRGFEIDEINRFMNSIFIAGIATKKV